ncbi:unnamed protein product [Malus baccata var. baccata]
MAFSSKKDFSWQWTKDLDPVTKHFYCVFCNHKYTGSISRFKHHLGGVSSGGMISCKKVPPNVKEECFANVMGTKEKRKASHELCRGGGEESESIDMGTTRTPYVNSGSGSQGPLDRYITLEARQATLNTLFKKEERRQASRAIARWFYTSVIPFNAANNEHYVNAMKLVEIWMHYYVGWMVGWQNPQGTWFLKSIDASASIKNGDLLYGYLDDVIQEVGEENVVQVISDNASNYKNAEAKLMERKEKVLALMRKYTNYSEILRPAVIRFATSFLTLQSLQKQKDNLVALFASQEWSESTYAKSHEAKLAKHHVLHDREFWGRVSFCIKGVLPLVCVLREVDSEERPPMGFIYELMDAKKKKIMSNLNKVEKKYMPIWRKIDRIWDDQLHQPLHAAGYYLNPQFRYEDDFLATDKVVNGLFACMDRILWKGKEREEADCQLDLYNDKRGPFADFMAMQTRKKRTPTWWECFGHKTPELRKFDVRRSKKMREKYDPIVVEELVSDDEWITEIEDPVLPEDPTWLEDELLYNVEAVRNVPPPVYEGVPYIREPRESSTPHPREPTPPPCELTPHPSLLLLVSLLNLRVLLHTKENEYDSEESFDELMKYPTRSSRVGNEEDDAFYLDEEDLDD